MHIEVIRKPRELIVCAVDFHRLAKLRGESGLKRGDGVGSARSGYNAGVREPRVRRERLKQAHGPGEVVDGFVCGLVGSIARRIQSADTGAVRCPLFVPEALVVSFDGLPVRLHVLERGGGIGPEGLV